MKLYYLVLFLLLTNVINTNNFLFKTTQYSKFYSNEDYYNKCGYCNDRCITNCVNDLDYYIDAWCCQTLDYKYYSCPLYSTMCCINGCVIDNECQIYNDISDTCCDDDNE